MKEKIDNRDFDKFAHFSSKAKNYAIVYKPHVTERLAGGETVTAKDKEGKELIGLRLEFENHNFRIEKSKENEKIIAFLRKKCEGEKQVSLKMQQLKEIQKPIKKIEETKVKEMLSAKDKEIEELKKKLAKTKVDDRVDDKKKDEKKEDKKDKEKENKEGKTKEDTSFLN